MNELTAPDIIQSFNELTPDLVIAQVEEALGVRCTGLCRSLNSYINRVFELQLDRGDSVVAKFYRPGRWSRLALQDEQDFLSELHELEIPVIAPLANERGTTLHEFRGIYFTIFPKKLGRGLDEPSPEEWETLGRLLARVHRVGATHAPRDRVTLAPKQSMRENIRFILDSGVLPGNLDGEYEDVAMSLLELIDPMFKGIEMIRIHGDCHQGNIVNRPGESFYLIDFDDMAIGPPVQDIWMLLPGYIDDSRAELEMLLEGYETFREFDRSTLRLIEPLRAMRFLHFAAWCAVQAVDNSAARLAPGWGTPGYWQIEIQDLRNQREKILQTQDFRLGQPGL